MSSHGIKDRVAIIGMGCTPFREHWDKGTDDLMIDAAKETFASAGLDKEQIDAFWFGTAQSAMSGVPMAAALKLENKPVSRVENFCATGSEALRQACYAVASGAYDTAMALGVEGLRFTRDRLKDKEQPAELVEQADSYKLVIREHSLALELHRESAAIRVIFGEGKPREFDFAKDRHIAPADVEEYVGRRSLELVRAAQKSTPW